MLRTNLDAWKAALYVAVGLSTIGCGGEQEGADAALPGDTSTAKDDDSEPLELPAHLRCEGDEPNPDDPSSRRCDNGIVHRTAPPAAEVCDECPSVGPVLNSSRDRCVSDDDCRPGALCVLSRQLQRLSGCPVTTTAGGDYLPAVQFWACQAPEDECGADVQCGPSYICAGFEGGRQCTSYDPFPCGVPGRPFLIGTEARVASAVPGTNWCEPIGDGGELDGAARAELSRHWRETALMEHASIAAFARFTLQLLQLGAPHDLVLESQRAMLDETEHARRCFSLAARYASRALGPGPLPIAGALHEESPATIIRLTFLEGCVGETVAALDAAEALADARDPEVRRTLELIARDELRHATLAWRFLAWALARDANGEVREVLQDELRRLRATAASTDRSARPDEPAHHPALACHGQASAEQRRRLRQAAITELVLPCCERWLASRAVASSAAHAGAPAGVGVAAARPA